MGLSSKPTHVGNAPLSTGTQSSFIDQGIKSGMGGYGDIMQQLLQPYDPEQFQSLFQQAFIDPAMMNYEQTVIPGIQERFGGMNASSSSALNQALASSAKDLSTSIGTQAGQFYQNQQGNQINLMQLLNQLAGQKTFDPMIQEGYNPMSDIIKALGSLGASGVAASSKHYKKNIKNYGEALDKVKSLVVKNYDYNTLWGGAVNRVGLIAEEVPDEIRHTGEFTGVDVYGLASMLVKAVQELTQKVETLEAQCQLS